ncbi:NADH-quinone oxidoreductase subunit C [Chromatiales bacterium (ex Bugula neritina AB1)]|nr:NADH-quinone oxidoreductase subunit C [Chromatiales bacterium (ex Bugula neritina AB1)]
MNEQKIQEFAEQLRTSGIDGIVEVSVDCAEVTATVDADKLPSVALRLRDELSFEQLMDVCGVDYLEYGKVEWQTDSAAAGGFSRGVSGSSVGRLSFGDEVSVAVGGEPRFAAVYQLLSLKHNRRLRLKVFASDNEFPVVPTVTDVWACADWPEREAFDLYGIHFEGHPDLRRLLTDYGFVGHPFRKDFPLVGNVEMRYDPQKKRVIYEAVSIEPRVLVPRVIRKTTRRNTGTAVDTSSTSKGDA